METNWISVKWLYTDDIPFSDETIREWRSGRVVGTIRKFFTDYFIVNRNGALEYIPIKDCQLQTYDAALNAEVK